MPFTAIIFGVLLILTGVIGYIYGMMNPPASLTALIPAAFGIVLALLGLSAQSMEGMRKHLMHAAVTVALFGFLVPAARVLSKMSEITLSAAYVLQIVMAVLCLTFVIMAINSFVAARRARL
jgi:hypothetical protein